MAKHHPAKKSLMLRVAAGLAVAAVGATAIFDRSFHAEKGPAPKDDGTSGRGTSGGPVNAPSLAAGYEIADTNIRSLAIIMVVSLAIMVLGVGLVFWMFAGFDRHYREADTGLTVEQRAPIDPPLPHLQAFPYREIDALITEQKQRLDTYGWDSDAHKQAHIPIERAMRQVIGKPLDAAASADAAGAPVPTQPMPDLPDHGAAIAQERPANRIQGEGRPGAVAPSFTAKPEHKP